MLRDEEAAVIRRNNVRVLTRQRIAAQERFDVGEGTRTDIAQADARLAASEIGLANADASLAVSRAAYVRFVGHTPANLTKPPQYILPTTLPAALNRGRANNPQLIAARYNEKCGTISYQHRQVCGPSKFIPERHFTRCTRKQCQCSALGSGHYHGPTPYSDLFGRAQPLACPRRQASKNTLKV